MTTKGKQVAIVKDETQSLIQVALEKGADVAVLTQLFELQKSVKAEQAREAYVKDMGNFQAECPTIEKKKPVKNKSGQVVYKYAPLDSIVEQVKKHISKNNFSYNFEVKKDTDFLTTVCNVTHVQGHKETSEFMVPIGTESYMTDPQKYGARATFAKRNAFCNAFGILTGDEDTDATQTDKKEKAPLNDKAKIIFLLRQLDVKTATVEETNAEIKKLTQLDVKEENYAEIVNRLSVLVDERKQDNSKA